MLPLKKINMIYFAYPFLKQLQNWFQDWIWVKVPLRLSTCKEEPKWWFSQTQSRASKDNSSKLRKCWPSGWAVAAAQNQAEWLSSPALVTPLENQELEAKLHSHQITKLNAMLDLRFKVQWSYFCMSLLAYFFMHPQRPFQEETHSSVDLKWCFLYANVNGLKTFRGSLKAWMKHWLTPSVACWSPGLNPLQTVPGLD